jgi:fatty-acyl-CoA synthase
MGDLGVRDEDRYLYFRGRLDDRMKTGGENVYPAEVESVLLEMDRVADAAVVGVPDEQWGERICAAVVRADPSIGIADIEAHCRESDVLADYKRPREVAFVESVPKLENRKVVRRAVVDLFE